MDNKTIVRRYYEEVVNSGDVTRIAEFVSEEYTEVMDGKRHPVGIEGAASHLIGVRMTYPDLHLTVERQIAEEMMMIRSNRLTGITKSSKKQING